MQEEKTTIKFYAIIAFEEKQTEFASFGLFFIFKNTVLARLFVSFINSIRNKNEIMAPFIIDKTNETVQTMKKPTQLKFIFSNYMY